MKDSATASGLKICALEIDHFINEGFGWVCKHCSANVEARADVEAARARFFTEGEAEEKEPRLSTTALARWTNASHRALSCPSCGIEEMIDKA
ncbi:MAG TPA: hypothetical protein VM095_01425 [Pyrinomonadaceae bacterium]|nr:hypothetical protein [Pyrinomonadaceae bacterium]